MNFFLVFSIGATVLFLILFIFDFLFSILYRTTSVNNKGINKSKLVFRILFNIE